MHQQKNPNRAKGNRSLLAPMQLLNETRTCEFEMGSRWVWGWIWGRGHSWVSDGLGRGMCVQITMNPFNPLIRFFRFFRLMRILLFIKTFTMWEHCIAHTVWTRNLLFFVIRRKNTKKNLRTFVVKIVKPFDPIICFFRAFYIKSVFFGSKI